MRGHLRAFEIAALLHLLFQVGQSGLVGEHAQLARLGEVDHGGEEGGALDALLAFGRQPRQQAREQRSAQAVADDVGLALAGGLLDRVERGERALQHVVVEGLVREALVRIDPGDHEHRVTLRDRPADERVLLAQIEDVVLVDPRRDDQQRRAPDLLG